MENTSKIQKHLLNKYATEGYLNRYGSSVIISILLVLGFSSAFGYNYLQSSMKFLKKDFNKIRCNPLVIPFAGLINAPEGKSKMLYTEENLNHCMYDVMEDVVEVEKVAQTAAQTIVKDTIEGIEDAIDSARKLLDEVRDAISKMFSAIFSKIFSVMIPVQNTVIKAKNNLNNSQAILSTSLYTGVGTMLSFRSFLGAFVSIVIAFILILSVAFPAELASALGLVGIPFVGWILATPFFIAAAATLALVTAIVAIFVPLNTTVQEILTNTKKIKKSFCFDENTQISLRNGEKKKITEIKLGDQLKDGGFVTAKFKLSSHDHTMYNLCDVIVNGNHTCYEDGTPIFVKHHPLSFKLKEYYKPYLYCINTTTKKININGIDFLDWDELTKEDFEVLKVNVNKYSDNKFNESTIHRYFDSGFTEDTKIEMEDGRSVKLKDIEVNDVLKFGERVLGIVEIDGNNINSIKEYRIHGNTIYGTGNLIFNDNLGNMVNTSDIGGITIRNTEKIYNLVTDTSTFNIEGIRFFDYNSGLVDFLLKNQYYEDTLRTL